MGCSTSHAVSSIPAMNDSGAGRSREFVQLRTIYYGSVKKTCQGSHLLIQLNAVAK